MGVNTLMIQPEVYRWCFLRRKLASVKRDERESGRHLANQSLESTYTEILASTYFVANHYPGSSFSLY